MVLLAASAHIVLTLFLNFQRIKSNKIKIKYSLNIDVMDGSSHLFKNLSF